MQSSSQQQVGISLLQSSQMLLWSLSSNYYNLCSCSSKHVDPEPVPQLERLLLTAALSLLLVSCGIAPDSLLSKLTVSGLSWMSLLSKTAPLSLACALENTCCFVHP